MTPQPSETVCFEIFTHCQCHAGQQLHQDWAVIKSLFGQHKAKGSGSVWPYTQKTLQTIYIFRILEQVFPLLCNDKLLGVLAV